MKLIQTDTFASSTCCRRTIAEAYSGEHKAECNNRNPRHAAFARKRRMVRRTPPQGIPTEPEPEPVESLVPAPTHFIQAIVILAVVHLLLVAWLVAL